MDGRDAEHTIYPEQRQMLDWVSRGERQISERSGHGVGKSTVLAWIINWWAIVKYPQKTLCTAPTSQQLFDALAAETKAWMKKLPPALFELFEIQVEQIFLRASPEESFISFATSKAETPEALAGKHSKNMLLVADEASGIPDTVYEAASGSMSGDDATMILTGNPIRYSGLFYETFHRDRANWKTLHVSCLGDVHGIEATPVLKLGERHPNVSAKFIQTMKDRYGEDTNAYRVRVLGEFPKSEEDAVIPFDWVETALNRDVRPLNVRPIWGLDVAYKGSDRTALAKRKGNTLMEKVRCWKGLDNMQVAGVIHNEWRDTAPDDRPSEILVDAIGFGAGVADRLRELGLPCRGINVSELPSLKDRYPNQKAELWFTAREWFEPRDVNLHGDDALMAELVVMHYLPPTSSGKTALELTKDTRKANGGKSLDLASAFVLTFASQAVSALQGSRNSVSWTQPLKRKIAGIV